MKRRRRRCPALLALSVALLAPPMAAAHFVLRSPPSWRDQDVLGSPQKVGPCGDEGPAATTGMLTPFSPGETITITLDETVFHPGHYRVALAVNDRGELPAEPPVTPDVTPCGSVPIMAPPVFPVLADGVLEHSHPFSGTQSIQVTLPPDVTCAHCTLQMLEFMSNHGAPCFYHHCADISIQAPGNACTADVDCADGDACTTDRCHPATGTCENVAIDPAACDDGNACTRDTCQAAQGCVAQPVTLADVDAGFLGTLQVAACPTEQVPQNIRTLFQKAGALVTRAAHTPAKADRFLHRALKRLRGCAKKVEKVKRRSLSAACGTALADVLGGAQASVECLQVGNGQRAGGPRAHPRPGLENSRPGENGGPRWVDSIHRYTTRKSWKPVSTTAIGRMRSMTLKKLSASSSSRPVGATTGQGWRPNRDVGGPPPWPWLSFPFLRGTESLTA